MFIEHIRKYKDTLRSFQKEGNENRKIKTQSYTSIEWQKRKLYKLGLQ